MSYSRIGFEILDSKCLFWNYSRIGIILLCATLFAISLILNTLIDCVFSSCLSKLSFFSVAVSCKMQTNFTVAKHSVKTLSYWYLTC